MSFDWEILPDGTCPNGTVSSCDTHADAAWPDFSFEANDVLLKHFFGVLPGQVGLTGTTTKLEFIDWPRMIAIDIC